MTIPGINKSINSIIEEASTVSNGLTGVPTATGLAAYLDIDTYILAYLNAIRWIGADSVADGGVTVSEIWTGLADFLKAHWMITLPGIGAQGNPSFFTVNTSGTTTTVFQFWYQSMFRPRIGRQACTEMTAWRYSVSSTPSAPEKVFS